MPPAYCAPRPSSPVLPAQRTLHVIIIIAYFSLIAQTPAALPQLTHTSCRAMAQFCFVQRSGRGGYSRRACRCQIRCEMSHLYIFTCADTQEHRERRGKEITELLRRQWEYGKVKEVAAAKHEVAAAQLREQNDKEEINAVAVATRVIARMPVKKCCFDSVIVCHQGPVT